MSVIFLMGQTATGKTALSLALAEHMPIEVISVDSTNVYRGMDIGTAKPSIDERGSIPHHLVDILDPWESYAAGQFALDARQLIHEIRNRGNTPVLVGGTMLYFQTLLRGYDGGPSTCPKIREAILSQADKIGWQAMWEQLKNKDAEAAQRIHPNDKQRVGRALEKLALVSKTSPETIIPPLSDEHKITQIALLAQDRNLLRKRIAIRLKAMLDAGFIDEVKHLLDHPKITPELVSMKSVGYAQACQYLQGKLNFDEMIGAIQIATSQLAKRQHTWLNQFPDACQLDCFSENLKGIFFRKISGTV